VVGQPGKRPRAKAVPAGLGVRVYPFGGAPDRKNLDLTPPGDTT
jgi:hypothetical protein